MTVDSRESVLGTLASVADRFIPFLKPIENRIESCLSAEAPLLNEIALYLHRLGGKRIRPLLTSLAASIFGMEAPSPQLIDAAAGIEMIHMATLLHDDIIDGSDTRRGKPSALRQFGATPSLLAGDFLLVQAFGLCARLDPFVIEETRRACVELTEGEVAERAVECKNPPTWDEYLWVTKRKTASLFCLACTVGAHLSGASPEAVSLFGKFGEQSGLAFQIVDDILDVTASQDLLGKPSGLDLKQKTPSIVNILWLESGSPEAKAFFSKGEISREDVEHAKAAILESTVLEECRRRARQRQNEARAVLDRIESFAKEPARVADLRLILDFTVSRCL